MSIRGVAFDLDYTLAVPNRDRETLLSEAVERVGGPPISRAAYLDAHQRHLTTESREPIFAELLTGVDDTEYDTDPEALATAYRQAVTTSLVPISGVESMLTELRSRYQLGLLTNGPVRAQRSKIEFLDFERLFDTTLVTGELSAGKPAAAAFNALLAALGTTPEETVYVGDTPFDDIEGATEAGIYAIQVLFEGGPEKDPRADAYIQRDRMATELPGLLAGLAPENPT